MCINVINDLINKHHRLFFLPIRNSSSFNLQSFRWGTSLSEYLESTRNFGTVSFSTMGSDALILLFRRPADTKHNFNSRGFLTFEPVTVVPPHPASAKWSIRSRMLTSDRGDGLPEPVPQNVSRTSRAAAQGTGAEGGQSSTGWSKRETEPIEKVGLGTNSLCWHVIAKELY